MKYIDALDSPCSQLDENISYESDTVDCIDRKILFENVNKAIETLCEREIACIRARIDGLTLKEISITFKVSTERIRQIISKAIRKLRHPLRSEPLRHIINHMSKFEIEEEKEERKRFIKQLKETERKRVEKEQQEILHRHLNYPYLKTMPSYLKLEIDEKGEKCIKMRREDWRRTTPEIARSWLNHLIAEEKQNLS